MLPLLLPREATDLGNPAPVRVGKWIPWQATVRPTPAFSRGSLSIFDHHSSIHIDRGRLCMVVDSGNDPKTQALAALVIFFSGAIREGRGQTLLHRHEVSASLEKRWGCIGSPDSRLARRAP